MKRILFILLSLFTLSNSSAQTRYMIKEFENTKISVTTIIVENTSNSYSMYLKWNGNDSILLKSETFSDDETFWEEQIPKVLTIYEKQLNNSSSKEVIVDYFKYTSFQQGSGYIKESENTLAVYDLDKKQNMLLIKYLSESSSLLNNIPVGEGTFSSTYLSEQSNIKGYNYFIYENKIDLVSIENRDNTIRYRLNLTKNIFELEK